MRSLRSWVTLITTGSFLLLAITGLLMFFKVRDGLIVVSHEWLSPIFFVGASLHIWLNWKAILGTISKAKWMVIVGLFVAMLFFSIFPAQHVVEHAREHGHGQEEIGQRATELLLGASISTVASLEGRSTSEIREALLLHGIRVASDDDTLVQAARKNQVPTVRVLDAVLVQKY